MKDLLLFFAALLSAVLTGVYYRKLTVRKGYKKFLARVLTSVFSLAVFIIVLSMLIVATDEKSDTKQQVAAKSAKPVTDMQGQIKQLSIDITEVSLAKDVITITTLKKPIWDGKHWVTSFFSDAYNIVKSLPKISGISKFNTLKFLVKIPTTNQMGKEDEQLGMVVTYSIAPFKDANWDNMSPWNMANLAEEIQFRRLGLESSVEYCKDADNAKYADTFCTKVLNSALSQ